MTTVPLADQLACVKRELTMRRSVYPRRVNEGKMAKADMDKEIARMQAVFDTLRRLVEQQEPALL